MNQTAATATGSSGGLIARLRPLALPLVSIVLIAAAAVVIHLVTRDVRIHQVRDALAAIPLLQMGLAVLFTAVSFAALGMFDVLAVTAVAPGAVTYRVAAAAGALGHAVSNVLGFGVLTGGALRYRIYSAEGLDAASVLRVIGTSYFALVFGFMTLLGLTLIIDPGEVAPLRWLGPSAAVILGAAILASIAAFLAWTAWACARSRFAAGRSPSPARVWRQGRSSPAASTSRPPPPPSTCSCPTTSRSASRSFSSSMAAPSCSALRATLPAGSAPST